MTPNDPFALFDAWYAEAQQAEPRDANAMTLATQGAGGRPDARTVLMKERDADGFVFYTNLQSKKAQDLTHRAQAALLFFWKSLGRQIRIQGAVAPVDPAVSDAYFASRTRGSQIGAWASPQSKPIDGRADLEARVAEIEARFQGGAVPRPDFWGGYRLTPQRFEFWQEGPHRLHDREVYVRDGVGWTGQRLAP